MFYGWKYLLLKEILKEILTCRKKLKKILRKIVRCNTVYLSVTMLK